MNDEYKEIDYFGRKVIVDKKGSVVIYNGRCVPIRYNHDGYPICTIGNKEARVHRLVAMAFIPNPNNLPEVNHKDYNRANSNVENLEWISHADNVRYSVCNRPDYRGSKNPNYGNRKLHEKYKNDKELSREKQGRKGLKNGRCRKIKIYKNNVLVKEFDYIVQCIEYLNKNGHTKGKLESIRSQIDASIRKNREYKGFVFVKE